MVSIVAAVIVPRPLLVDNHQLWALLIGSLVPLVTYVLNSLHHLGEPVKAFVLLLASAFAAALYTALSTNVIGFNAATLELVVTGVVGALGAHHLLWKPSGVSDLLRARPRRAARRSRK